MMKMKKLEGNMEEIKRKTMRGSESETKSR